MTDVDLLKKIVNDKVNKTPKNFTIKKVDDEPVYEITNKVNGKTAIVPVFAVNETLKALEKLF